MKCMLMHTAFDRNQERIKVQRDKWSDVLIEKNAHLYKLTQK